MVSVPVAAEWFLRDHIEALREWYDVYLVGDITDEKEVERLNLTGWQGIGIQRDISLAHDVKAMWQAYRYFKRMKFDAIHSMTPKAGLIAALAGWMAGIQHRTHIFTGQVWATRKGVMRAVLKSLDKLVARLDNHIMVDGKSQRAFLVKEGVLREGQAMVFANGSINGVNAERFVPDAIVRQSIRKKLGIGDGVLCFLFLGRLTRDKGIGELYEAFDRLASEASDVFLLLVGWDEGKYLEKLPAYGHIHTGKNFHFYGPTPEPEKVLNAGDVFVLPSYREGFGTSVLEAACIGLPSICSDVYGVLDAYVVNETGLPCRVGDAESLYRCMRKLYDDREMMRRMGEKARERALRDFNVKDITAAWVDFYHNILSVVIQQF